MIIERARFIKHGNSVGIGLQNIVKDFDLKIGDRINVTLPSLPIDGGLITFLFGKNLLFDDRYIDTLKVVGYQGGKRPFLNIPNYIKNLYHTDKSIGINSIDLYIHLYKSSILNKFYITSDNKLNLDEDYKIIKGALK